MPIALDVSREDRAPKHPIQKYEIEYIQILATLPTRNLEVLLLEELKLDYTLIRHKSQGYRQSTFEGSIIYLFPCVR